MRQWPVQDAKAHFSEMLDTCLEEGPQLVSRRGKGEAVLVPLSEWEHIQRRMPRNAKEVLLSPEPRFELDLPDRGQWTLRPPISFE